MTNQHPITPPRRLVQQWIQEARSQDYCSIAEYVAHRAAQRGYEQRGEVNEAKLQEARDEELEACCKWLDYNCPSVGAHHLRNDRRPKPPSLKEQALMALEDGDTGPGASLTPTEVSIIRRALEALSDD